MTRCVLDTSVAVAWYLPEEFSESAISWQDRMLEDEVRLVVPRLHFWELGNVLRTYVRRAELDADTAREIFSVHLAAPLEIEEPPREGVLKTSLDYGATVYDAVFIRLSLDLRIPLLTAERTTTPWVSRLGGGALTIR